MKIKLLSALTFAALALSLPRVQAEAFNQLKVSSDTKWLVHVDLEGFRGTQVGKFVDETLLGPHREKLQADIKRELGFELDWNQVKSLTAFGNDYEIKPESAGLLMLKTDTKLQTNFKQLLESKIESGFGPVTIQPIKSKLDNLYAIAGELFVALEPDGLFLFGKTRGQVEGAKATLTASQTPLNQSEAFASYPTLPNTMVFLAVADAFGDFAKIPPQAQVLKMSKGARIALCETDEKILLQAELKTPDAKSSRQILAVIQGMVTLAMLSGGDERIVEIAEAINVSTRDAIVTMKLELPIDRALGTLKRFAQ